MLSSASIEKFDLISRSLDLIAERNDCFFLPCSCFLLPFLCTQKLLLQLLNKLLLKSGCKSLLHQANAAQNEVLFLLCQRDCPLGVLQALGSSIVDNANILQV